jgi:5'-3' exonuclease
MTNKKVVLIDGSSLLTTNFYGTAPKGYSMVKTDEERETFVKDFMQTSTGVLTNGVYGMMESLLRIIEKQKPTHLAVAWDLGRDKTFRRKMYPLYKSNRSETKKELKPQFALAQKVLSDMNIAQFMYESYEADDVIGTLSTKFGQEAMVYIWAKDQDALQLVSDNVRLWFRTDKAEEMYQEVGIDVNALNVPDRCFEFTPDYVRQFYRVEPIQIIDRKAIEGDTSDFIPGVKNVGEASVVPLLNEFSTVEGIYEFLEDHEEVEAKMFMRDLGIKRTPYNNLMKTSETELVGKKSAFLSKTLATIKTDIEELKDVSLNDITLNINEIGKKQAFEALEFKSLLEAEKEKVSA